MAAFDIRGKRTWEDTVTALPKEKRVLISFNENRSEAS